MHALETAVKGKTRTDKAVAFLAIIGAILQAAYPLVKVIPFLIINSIYIICV
jgi:hypothetical protein